MTSDQKKGGFVTGSAVIELGGDGCCGGPDAGGGCCGEPALDQPPGTTAARTSCCGEPVAASTSPATRSACCG